VYIPLSLFDCDKKEKKNKKTKPKKERKKQKSKTRTEERRWWPVDPIEIRRRLE
jgi:hypothetical protein